MRKRVSRDAVSSSHPETIIAALPIAFRAHIQRLPRRTPAAKVPPAFGWPDSVLVLDTETTTDPAQPLVFGSWRFGHWGPCGEFLCLEEGLFYADGLPQTDPPGWQALQEYVCSHLAHTKNARRRELLFVSRREFVNDRLWKALEGGALVVGYNLPFDLARLAIDVGLARGPMFTGGFSFALFEYCDRSGIWRENLYRPRLRLKNLDSKRALMGLSRRRGARPEERQNSESALGRFLDLKALVFALTDRHLSLDQAAEQFGLAEHKLTVHGHGQITTQYVDYNRQDVALTVALLEAVRAEWDQHPLALSPDKVLSPAGLAKGYLRALGVTPPAVKFADVPAEFLGAAMSSYYGGRSEVRLRRVPVPVAYLDFLSMYPTVNALLGLWPLLIAERLQVVDGTRDVERLIQELTLERCFSPEFWRSLCFFAKVRPARDILPVRAQYDPATSVTSIGVNPFLSEEPVWVAGPDLVASCLLTGRYPEILEAMRLVPVGQQAGLQPVALRGRISIDPTKDDFFRRLIEARREIKGNGVLPKEERERLERFLKVLANAGAYGIYAELNVQPPDNAEQGDAVIVYGGDGSFPSRTLAPEEPGEYCFPPFAALTTAAARLMLALLERCVTDQSGTIAFGDTDSAAIVALPKRGLVACPGSAECLPDGTPAIRALSWNEVEAIRRRFEELNPYNRDLVSGSILKLEDINFAEDGSQRVLSAFAISAKRYTLFTIASDGSITILEAKEHGLGHLLNPIDPDAETRDWISDVWEAIVREALGHLLEWPSWAHRPAVSRVSVSTADLLRTFDPINSGKPYNERIKPTNFGLSVQVAPLGYPMEVDPERFHLLAAYERDPRRWREMLWYDKYSSCPFKIGVGRDLAPDRVQVKSYRDVLDEYRVHPEPKSLGPDGQPCHRATAGILARRPVREGQRYHIGKESHRHEEVAHGLVHDVHEVRATYQDPRHEPWQVCVRPVLKRMSRKRLAKATGRSERQVQAIRNGRAGPGPATGQKLTRAAVAFATRLLANPAADPTARGEAERLLASPLASRYVTGGAPEPVTNRPKSGRKRATERSCHGHGHSN